jgi:hypothetical protein
MLEKNLIDDPTLPIASYNYSAIRDRLIKRDIKVSAPTIIARQKASVVISLIQGRKYMTVR